MMSCVTCQDHVNCLSKDASMHIQNTDTGFSIYKKTQHLSILGIHCNTKIYYFGENIFYNGLQISVLQDMQLAKTLQFTQKYHYGTTASV